MKITSKNFNPAIHLLDESLPKKVHQSIQDIREICYSAQLKDIEYDIYSFSFSYNDNKMSRIHNRTFAMLSNERIHHEVLYYLKNYCKKNKIFILVFPEFSPDKLRLHWHGVLKGSQNKLSNLAKYMKVRYGYLEDIKVLKNYQWWTYYMQKDNHKREKCLPIIFHDPSDVYQKDRR